jgi:hypothetical protein
VLPLSLVNFMANQQANRLDTFLVSLSPILISIPALFILTLFFTGRAVHLQREPMEGEAQKAPGFFEHYIQPSLPLAAVLWLLLLFFNAQDLFWPILVNFNPERYNLNILLFLLLGRFGTTADAPASAIIFFVLPACVFFFLSLVPFQLSYLDRLTLYAENPSTKESNGS